MQGENGAVQGAAGQVRYKVDSCQNRNDRKRRETDSRPRGSGKCNRVGDNALALLTARLAWWAWLGHPYPATGNH